MRKYEETCNFGFLTKNMFEPRMILTIIKNMKKSVMYEENKWKKLTYRLNTKASCPYITRQNSI